MNDADRTGQCGFASLKTETIHDDVFTSAYDLDPSGAVLVGSRAMTGDPARTLRRGNLDDSWPE